MSLTYNKKIEVVSNALGLRRTVFSFNFDLAGRLTQRDYRTAANSPAGAIADSDVFTHNASGQTLTADSGRYNNQVAMTYDVAGRLQDESLTISGQTYTVGNQYDVRGQLWKQTYRSGKVVERLYHDDGQLHQVKFDGSLVDTRLYDDGGRLDSSTYGNELATGFTYCIDKPHAVSHFDSEATELAKIQFSPHRAEFLRIQLPRFGTETICSRQSRSTPFDW